MMAAYDWPIAIEHKNDKKENGIVDLQHRSMTRASLVLLVFIMNPFFACPQSDKAAFTAVDFSVFIFITCNITMIAQLYKIHQ